MKTSKYLNQLQHLVGISLICREYNNRAHIKLKTLQYFLNQYAYISTVVNVNYNLHVDTMAVISNIIIVEDILKPQMLRTFILAIQHQRFEYTQPFKESVVVYPQSTTQIIDEINKAIDGKYKVIFKMPT